MKTSKKNDERNQVMTGLDDATTAMLGDIQRHLCCKTRSTALVWAIVNAHKLLEFIDRAVAEAVPQIVRDGLRSGKEEEKK